MKYIILIFSLGLTSVISNPVTTSTNKKPYLATIKDSETIDVTLDTSDSTEESVISKIEDINNSAYDVPSATSQVTGNIEVIIHSADNLLPKENEEINEIEEYSTTPQNTEEIGTTDLAPNFVDGTFGDGVVDIVVEDNPVPSGDTDNTIPFKGIPEIQSPGNDGLSIATYLYRKALQSRIEDEIMASAKGFAPLPFFGIRRKQNIRRRVPMRRRYSRFPYRRFYSAYPYYAYYRPSSLRFY